MSANDSDCLEPIELVGDKSRFDELGYGGPFSLADDSCMADFQLGPQDPRYVGSVHVGWHMFSPSVQAVFSDRNLVNKISALCGDDMVIWRSGYFVKKPTYTGEIGWHHDKHFQGADASSLDFDEIETHFSLLLAMNDMGDENGRMELIPGSHKTIPGYDRDCRILEASDPDRFVKDLPQHLIDQRRAVILKKGQFLIFHSGLLHRSLPYATGDVRRSFVVRLVPANVEVPDHLYPFYRAVTRSADNGTIEV